MSTPVNPLLLLRKCIQADEEERKARRSTKRQKEDIESGICKAGDKSHEEEDTSGRRGPTPSTSLNHPQGDTTANTINAEHKTNQGIKTADELSDKNAGSKDTNADKNSGPISDSLSTSSSPATAGRNISPYISHQHSIGEDKNKPSSDGKYSDTASKAVGRSRLSDLPCEHDSSKRLLDRDSKHAQSVVVNTDVDSKMGSDDGKPENKCTKILKGIYRLISSSVGLVTILLCYSFIGAAILQAIEAPHERQEKHEIIQSRDDIIGELWNKTKETGLTIEQWRTFALAELEEYEWHVRDAAAHGVSSDSTETVWDFWGSVFFCATVYTTIGYGHIAPATGAGRIATMIYSIIGIPLCLIVFADLGKLFTRIIKFCWGHTRRYVITGQCRRGENMKTRGGEVYKIDDEFNLPVWLAIAITVLYILIGAIMYVQWETNWGYLEAFYFIFISISTIGFGDILPDHPKYFMLSFLYVFVGLSLVAMVINVVMEALTKTIDIAKEKLEEVSKNVIGIDLAALNTDSDSESDISKEKQNGDDPDNKPRIDNGNHEEDETRRAEQRAQRRAARQRAKIATEPEKNE
ncbi:unnamed protein product [Owenia fusiformis]|uniref:Uncharacterized protein n=1 Tax=Owenia fusiformis TaxID=6347 RepID=A0A8J1T6I7_OWEFU|nr:unnamed protein product [Owenia fusiformis]